MFSHYNAIDIDPAYTPEVGGQGYPLARPPTLPSSGHALGEGGFFSGFSLPVKFDIQQRLAYH